MNQDKINFYKIKFYEIHIYLSNYIILTAQSSLVFRKSFSVEKTNQEIKNFRKLPTKLINLKLWMQVLVDLIGPW